jgi:hypothetical protein
VELQSSLEDVGWGGAYNIGRLTARSTLMARMLLMRGRRARLIFSTFPWLPSPMTSRLGQTKSVCKQLGPLPRYNTKPFSYRLAKQEQAGAGGWLLGAALSVGHVNSKTKAAAGWGGRGRLQISAMVMAPEDVVHMSNTPKQAGCVTSLTLDSLGFNVRTSTPCANVIRRYNVIGRSNNH